MSTRSSVIDLRSDTVTKPSAGMRQAMAAAEVGDDVFGEDPTVNLLEERAAALLGKEAALFVPSGSMANQIALKVHCQPGEEVVIGEGSHNYFYEAGAAGAIAGVQFAVVGRGGTFTAADVEEAYKPEKNHSLAPTRLVCVENTHNRGGGVVWRREDVAGIAAFARSHELALHLDGARLMNAAVASGVKAADLAAPFDTASLCFSKGLGAPIGSVFAGSKQHRYRAHRLRKMMGGAMRQVGILAAAALYALDHNVDRLAEDHANARLLGERLAGVDGLKVDLSRLVTNIVLIELSDKMTPAPAPAEALATALREQGVLCLATGARRLRLVTHLDVSRADCQRAAEVIADAASKLRSAGK
jgi:threonine aldolase